MYLARWHRVLCAVGRVKNVSYIPVHFLETVPHLTYVFTLISTILMAVFSEQCIQIKHGWEAVCVCVCVAYILQSM